MGIQSLDENKPVYHLDGVVVAISYKTIAKSLWHSIRKGILKPRVVVTILVMLNPTCHVSSRSKDFFSSLFVWSDCDSSTHWAGFPSANLNHLFKWHLTSASSLTACADQITSWAPSCRVKTSKKAETGDRVASGRVPSLYLSVLLSDDHRAFWRWKAKGYVSETLFRSLSLLYWSSQDTIW